MVNEKPRCKACVPCPMGVVGCEDDSVPHGHGSAKRCEECGISYYHVHLHSEYCSKASAIYDDVKHDEHNMTWQLMMARKERDCRNLKKQNTGFRIKYTFEHSSGSIRIDILAGNEEEAREVLFHTVKRPDLYSLKSVNEEK